VLAPEVTKPEVSAAMEGLIFFSPLMNQSIWIVRYPSLCTPSHSVGALLLRAPSKPSLDRLKDSIFGAQHEDMRAQWPFYLLEQMADRREDK